MVGLREDHYITSGRLWQAWPTSAVVMFGCASEVFGLGPKLAAHAWAALSCIMALHRLRTELFHRAWLVRDSQAIVGDRFLSIVAVGIFLANISTLWDSSLAAGSRMKP